jgi:hypothetical protein
MLKNEKTRRIHTIIIEQTNFFVPQCSCHICVNGQIVGTYMPGGELADVQIVHAASPRSIDHRPLHGTPHISTHFGNHGSIQSHVSPCAIKSTFPLRFDTQRARLRR